MQTVIDFLLGRFRRTGAPFLGEDGRTYERCSDTGALRLCKVQFEVNPSIPRPRPPEAQEDHSLDNVPLGVERFL